MKRGHGAAWTIRTADLDGNDTQELIYGGNGVVAMGQDGQPLWTFELPAVENKQSYDAGNLDEDKLDVPERDQGPMGDDPRMADSSSDDSYDQEPSDQEPSGQEPSGQEYVEEDNEQKYAEKLRFMGVHVRDLRASEGTLLVLDSENRVHRLDAATGKLLYTVELEGKGNACDFALLDADGDDVPDFFPSGGTSAYSGATGQKLWDADIDFTPSIVRSGNLDTRRGRELLLIGNPASSADKDAYNICPAEKNALMAMHQGPQEGSQEEGGDRAGTRLPGMDSAPQGTPSGIVAVDAKGKTLFTGNVPQAEIYTASIYDLDGDRRGEAIIGLRDNLLTLDSQGQVVQEFAVNGTVDEILVEDLDKDDQDELIVHAYDQDQSTVYAFGQDGVELWNATLGARAYVVEAIDLDGDGTNELVTGLGYAAQQDVGAVREASTVAWTLGANGPEELWRVGTMVPARALVAIEGAQVGADPAQMGGNELLIASGDARLHTVSFETGQILDSMSAGSMNHATGAGDLNGDGTAEVINGDVFGHITAIGQDGELLFETQLQGDGPAVVTGIEVARHGEGNPGMFVVSGFSWSGESAGVLQVFDDQGETLFSVTTPNGLAEARFADLDGDGRQEIVVPYFGFRVGQETGRSQNWQDTQGRPEDTQGRPEDTQGRPEDTHGQQGQQEPNQQPAAGQQACGVMAYDLDGNLLWQQEMESCDIAQIAVGDIDGDGIDEVAYGDLGRNGPYHLALLDGEGQSRWEIVSERDDAVWIEIIDEGVAFGGRSDQEDGHVTVLNALDGQERWRMDVGGGGGANIPEMEGSPFGAFAGSLFGYEIDDVNGDGMADLAFTTANGDVQVVDGAYGEPIWEGSLEDAARQAGEDECGDMNQRQGNLVGGPLTYVPGTDGAPGLLVVTGFDFQNLGSEAFAFSVDTGDVVGSLPLDGFVVGVELTTGAGGKNGISITTMYDTYGLDVGVRQDERPQAREDEPGDQGGYPGEESDDLSLD